MNPHHHELRRAAAEAFQQSLEQLEQHLAPEGHNEDGSGAAASSSLTESPQPPQEPQGQPHQVDAIAFADAAADIERFIQSQK